MTLAEFEKNITEFDFDGTRRLGPTDKPGIILREYIPEFDSFKQDNKVYDIPESLLDDKRITKGYMKDKRVKDWYTNKGFKSYSMKEDINYININNGYFSRKNNDKIEEFSYLSIIPDNINTPITFDYNNKIVNSHYNNLIKGQRLKKTDIIFKE